MLKKTTTSLLLLSAFVSNTIQASPTYITEMYNLESEQMIGTISIRENEYGLVFTPDLVGLSAGIHGFHVHENPDCGTVKKEGKPILGGAAGSHYDPHTTDNHGYPWAEKAHLGDLPTLYVTDEGEAFTPVLAPRLKAKDIENRALMIHAHGDNYSDSPQPLGGGGKRVACGVVTVKH